MDKQDMGIQKTDIMNKLGMKKVELNKLIKKAEGCMKLENELNKAILIKQGEINSLNELLPKEVIEANTVTPEIVEG